MLNTNSELVLRNRPRASPDDNNSELVETVRVEDNRRKSYHQYVLRPFTPAVSLDEIRASPRVSSNRTATPPSNDGSTDRWEISDQVQNSSSFSLAAKGPQFLQVPGRGHVTSASTESFASVSPYYTSEEDLPMHLFESRRKSLSAPDLRFQHAHITKFPAVSLRSLAESHGNSSGGSSSCALRAMASPRSKSPRPVTPKKEDKDESFWDKIGTLGRKKRIKEVELIEQEGKNAIDSPGSPTQFDIPPEEYDLAEGEERSLIERRSYSDPKLRNLVNLLIDWINDELANQRIIVKSLEDDLYDGQVLQKLLEKLTGQKLEVPEVSQSEEGQRHKLQIVLGASNQVLGLPRWSQQKWSVDSVHSKSLVAILYLLVHLARHFRAPLRLPENVNVETVVVKKRNGKLEYRRVLEEITSTYDEFGMRCERDAFDTLLDHAPDKLQVVKKSLITFVNKHLNKINLEVTDIENQFHDGVYLILLMGLLEGYFVPLFEFHLTPKDFEQKVFNVAFSFELMQDAGLNKPKARPEDIVNLDLKSTLRVLYNLFAKYKNLG